MKNIQSEIDRARWNLKKGASDKLLLNKPFALGMYRFSMFIIDYYSRVRKNLKIDYDSFMIIQTIVSHSLYHLSKKKKNSSYSELESEWERLINKDDSAIEILQKSSSKNNVKLTISSICLVTTLPKETVRRKTNQLIKKKIIKNSKTDGLSLDKEYTKIFQNFVPATTIEISKVIKLWEKIGVLKNLINFKT
jgi:hypothetical protein